LSIIYSINCVFNYYGLSFKCIQISGFCIVIVSDLSEIKFTKFISQIVECILKPIDKSNIILKLGK